MSWETVIGVTDNGAYVFTAYRVLPTDGTNPVWLITHRNANGIIMINHGGLEGVISHLLCEFPDVYRVDYRDANNKLRESYPARAVPYHLAELVTKELQRGCTKHLQR
jgi:hypothetical protein